MKKLILKCSMPLLLLTGLFYPKPYEASAASGSVSINETNFPDPTFRAYVQSEFDVSGDYSLSEDELKNVKSIDVSDEGIGSLEGIEYFYNLVTLDCSHNGISWLDLEKNTRLKYLYCSYNILTSLDLTHNNLIKLDCSYNTLTSIDLSNQSLSQYSYFGGTHALRVYAPDYKVDLSTLPGNFDIGNVSNWSDLGDAIDFDIEDGKTLHFKDADSTMIIYRYQTGHYNYKDIQFRLCVDNVNPDLVITKQPTDVSAEYGECVNVKVKAIGKNPTYQWYLKKPGEASFSKSIITSDTYYVQNLSEKSCGSQIYCVITDENGKTAKTKTVTLKSKVAITQQPTDTLVKIGSKASTTVHATGNGLKYQWYVKDPTSTTFKTSVITSETYSFQMTDSKSGRQVYCVITDKYGNTVTSNTVTLGGPVKITAQPTNASATIGSTVKTTVTATGVGLKYQWYFKNPTSTTFAKSSVTDATYSATMTESKSERQVYCVITDKNGNTVTSNTVTLGSSVKITAQPTNASATIGSTVKTTVAATGVGLTYQWYYKNPSSTKFTLSSITNETYSFEMTESKSGRQVYCVITDKNGNTKKTNTVTLTSKVKITQQPKDVVGESSTKVTTTVKATGNDLKYQWYVRDLNDKDWESSSITTNEYSFVLDGLTYGRKVYCVITDKYGNEVKTRTVTFITPGFQVYYADGYRDDKKTFPFHANGALDLSAPYFDHNGAVIINGEVPYHGGDDSKPVLKLKICSDADWKVSSSANYVIFEDIAGNPINSGTKGASWLVVYLDKFLSDSTEPTRECTITIESDGEKREYTLVQENYTINDMSKSEYYNSKNITELLYEKADSNAYPKEYDMLDQILSGERITNGIIEYYPISGYYHIAISSRFTPSIYSPYIPVGNIEIDYILFSINRNTMKNDIIYRVEVCDAAGLRIEQGNDPLFTCNCPILSNVTNVTDETYEKKFEKANDSLDIIEFGVAWKAGVLFPKASPLASAIVGSTLDTLMGKLLEVRMEKIPNNSHNGNVSTTTYSIKEGCVLSEVGDCVQILCRKNEAVYPEIIASFNFVGPNNNIQQFVNSYTAE